MTADQRENRRRILVLCPYPVGTGAGQRLKFEQYYEDWRAAGYDVTVSPFMDRRLWKVVFERGHYVRKAVGVARGYLRRCRDLLRLRRFEAVYVFMWVTPIGPSFFERLTRLLARRLVFDLEDNVLAFQDHRSTPNPNPMLRFLRGPGKALYLVRVSDHVITSSPALNERCLTVNAKRACTYISSSVDTDRFVPANPYMNEGIVTVGWTGTFSSRLYLELVEPALRALAQTRRFRLRVISNFDYELSGVDLEVIRWTAEREVADLQGIDIGVYPLPVDDWVSGKSGLKAIQYMAFGLPCVATDVGTTPLIIRNEENGLLVRTSEEWVRALERLIDDPALRRRLGEQARRDAVAKYSTQANAVQYRSVLSSVVGVGQDV